MGIGFCNEFKRQASLFFIEKMKTARLALTDVTPAELMTEEATNGNAWPPDTRTMRAISLAAFEVDDFWRIMEILHKRFRFLKFDRKSWRVSYKALILLEYLLTHGPLSVAKEFQCDKDAIKEIGSFQYVDERGLAYADLLILVPPLSLSNTLFQFNWGLSLQNLSERVLKLLESETLRETERDRAHNLRHRIERFGSFAYCSSSIDATIRDSSVKGYGRCNSQYSDHQRHRNESNFSFEEDPKKPENRLDSWPGIGYGHAIEDHPLSYSGSQTRVPLLSTDE
ncbi:Epsin-2 [Morella rubra]|uniref:Epsin-2 n=1 Tax=Morella rubra TaxID=262757 RepID=A0A6A1W4Z4_9ROSI|nr:Epsin-2 [Morella rubra]